jgi:hypothetical protein
MKKKERNTLAHTAMNTLQREVGMKPIDII